MSQAAFIWGSPEILDRPLMVKVRLASFAGKLRGRAAWRWKSKNTSSAIKAIWRDEQISFNLSISPALQKFPVGLLGLTTMIPRVRDVIA